MSDQVMSAEDSTQNDSQVTSLNAGGSVEQTTQKNSMLLTALSSINSSMTLL